MKIKRTIFLASVVLFHTNFVLASRARDPFVPSALGNQVTKQWRLAGIIIALEKRCVMFSNGTSACYLHVADVLKDWVIQAINPDGVIVNRCQETKKLLINDALE